MDGGIRTGSNPPKTKIFVGRLPEDAKAPDLKRLFERYGVVTECDILNRYGFVHMKNEDMAAQAIAELDNSEFMGSHISVEQSTGKKSGRGRGGGGGGPMRGGPGGRGGMRGGMGMGRAPPPYAREQRGDFDRRGPGGMPPPMRNGYNGSGGGGYDNYDRGAGAGGGAGGGGGYDSYYGGGRMPPPPGMMAPRERPVWPREPERRPHPDMMRMQYERRAYPDMGGRAPYEGRPPPPQAAPSPFERRSAYDRPMASDMYQRRSPPSVGYGGMGGAGYDRQPPMDPYMQRRYPAPSPLDREMQPVPRRF